jgi:dTDP-4-dehydrorhamnose reductase
MRGAIGGHRRAIALAHLAAFTDVSAAFAQTGDESGLCHRINVGGTRNVAAACAAAGIHLIHVSTDFVFDGAKGAPYVETDAPNPIEWYGRTKLMAEEAVREGDAAHTIVRIAFPYVAGPAPKDDLVRTFLKKLRAGRKLKLFTDQLTTPTFADDIARGLALLARERPAGELFHIVGSSGVSPFELGRKICEVFALDPELVQPGSLTEYLKTDPRPRQRDIRLSNVKWTAYARERGLEAPLDLDAGLRRVLEAETASA